MSTIILGYEAPMQSWGNRSRFYHRETAAYPTKSGTIGLVAAALGRERTDAIDDLAALNFGVRTDQEGKILTDFQTEVQWHLKEKKSKPLTYRQYIHDAKYTVALEGEAELIEEIAAALQKPVYPLFLGRRSCPPAERIFRGIVDAPLTEVLETTKHAPWLASEHYRKKHPQRTTIRITTDASVHEQLADKDIAFELDTPISYDIRWRQYQLRQVAHYTVDFANDAHSHALQEHDPMSIV